ncbi:hypothetical protein CHELA40_13179 [Chelatococcus asaccharovorans]|nr:hypothetical protein CHELA40_13179 [Chelatococcus asaccharovorans]CAH1679836.1 hypothetical protein CHELA17_62441 [Chelatococcus asaccharovorans]
MDKHCIKFRLSVMPICAMLVLLLLSDYAGACPPLIQQEPLCPKAAFSITPSSVWTKPPPISPSMRT